MHKLLKLFFLFVSITAFAQTKVPGRVIDIDSKKPLAYAKITINNEQILTNIDGSFELQLTDKLVELEISYVGYQDLKVQVNKDTRYLQVGMRPAYEELETVVINSGPDPAEAIIQKAIANKSKNDPEKALDGFKYRSYAKFIIDNESSGILLNADSTSTSIKTIINEGRGYLSEKVSENIYSTKKGEFEDVLGVRTAGFKKPVYNVLAMKVNPFSLYKNNYKLYKTDYAGPLGNGAFRNYDYKILDTTASKKPAYIIYFKPKREQVVAGLEGILYLDTTSFAIQKAKAQLLGSVKLEVNYEYQYYPEEDIWFPKNQTTTIRPGAGGKEIAVFGGTIGVGAVQQKSGILGTILGEDKIANNLYLNSSVTNYEVDLDFQAEFPEDAAEINVDTEAISKPDSFWENNRKVEFSSRDQATEQKVDSLIRSNNIERKIQVKNAIASGSYPIGFWDLDLSKIFKFNNYEGIRLGFGGRTNEQFSENYNINGYTTYGFKDRVVKYGLGTQLYLNKRNSTFLNFNFSRDIDEIASLDYLKGSNTFSILEPRFVNISYFYNVKSFSAGIEHKITPRLNAQIRISREEIWQIKDYEFNSDNRIYDDYDLSFAKLSFLWQPFSTYLSTPEGDVLLEKNFPQFTGQIEQSFAALDGDFNFTRIGLKAEYEIRNLDQSRTEFIMEGNYGVGELPLTHAFHAHPNNPNRESVFRRFSVAGRNSFETMYFNEFYSDRQIMLHLRHQLRPFNITNNFRPELVFISRHVIGDFTDMAKHENINFNTLEHGFSEFGMELNKLIAGFGLSTAYRYGAYHLPTFKENFSFKFTLQLQL